MDGQKYWLWIAYEPNTYIHSCLLFSYIYTYIHISRERTILSVISFSSRSERNLEKGNQYTPMALITGMMIYACKWLRLKHIIYGTELKNIIERFIQHK
jgi:hypothetical protein